MKLPHDKFCVLPWISLETSPIGTIRPCCLADEEIKKPNGTKFNLIEDHLIEAQNSDYMQDLRDQFLRGHCPSTCRKCWDEENAGRTSKRMHTLERLKPYVENMHLWSADAGDLLFLDLKLGNICNLKCRICGSWSSSTFAAEEIKFSNGPEFHRDMNRMGAWPRENEHFWKELDFLSSELCYLEFTGGEPFMIKEHFEYLERLVERDLAKNIEIHYNTNGTQWPEEYIKVWEEFKHVEIAFSIDNVGERFEYERCGAKWDEVNQNIERFIALRETSHNISLQLCTTVNIYNVMYLEDVYKWKHFKDFDFVYWNMLHDAPYNCIKSLNRTGKDIAEACLAMAEVDDKTRAEFRKIVRFMRSGQGPDPAERIKELDRRRGHSLKEHYPVLYEAIIGDDE